MENKEYLDSQVKEFLDSLVHELMADPDWELPPELRFFLVADLEWGLLKV